MAPPVASPNAWPTANAFYEAPTMVAMVADGTDIGEQNGDDLDTVGLDVLAPGVPRPRRPRSQPDIDPATIEQPVWVSPDARRAANGSGKAARPGKARPSRRGLLLAAVAVAGLGAGAGSAAWAARRIGRAANPAPPTLDLGPLAFWLPGKPDVEFAGSFIADHRGYHRQAGFTRTEFHDGGSRARSVVASVASGAAFVGVTAPDILPKEISNGARLRVIGAQRQKSAWAIVSPADKPIRTPHDMTGMKIGMAAGSTAVWTSFLAAAGIAETAVTQVVTPDHLRAVADRQVDGALSSVIDAPTALARQGVATSTFLLADHGYQLVSNVYVVSADAVVTSRKKVKAFLAAEIHGWKDDLAEPMLGPQLLTDVYARSSGLDVTEQLTKNKRLSTLVESADTHRNGLFTMTDALIEANVRMLADSAAPAAARRMFDLSIIRELYTEQPGLV